MSDLAARPIDPVVGRPTAHESARLHVTGRAVYTDDLAALPIKALMARKAAIDPETERRLRAEIQHTGPYEHKGAQAQE